MSVWAWTRMCEQANALMRSWAYGPIRVRPLVAGSPGRQGLGSTERRTPALQEAAGLPGRRGEGADRSRCGLAGGCEGRMAVPGEGHDRVYFSVSFTGSGVNLLGLTHVFNCRGGGWASVERQTSAFRSGEAESGERPPRRRRVWPAPLGQMVRP